MSEDCPFCLYEKTEENCPGCFEGSNYRPKPLTNADRIRGIGRGMSKCDVCINKNYCVNHLDARTMCPQMDYVFFTPSYETNYDLLISKTPEELAEFMIGVAQRGGIPLGGKPMRWLDWLKSPVEVDE